MIDPYLDKKQAGAKIETLAVNRMVYLSMKPDLSSFRNLSVTAGSERFTLRAISAPVMRHFQPASAIF
jgi:hypothetical protein